MRGRWANVMLAAACTAVLAGAVPMLGLGATRSEIDRDAARRAGEAFQVELFDRLVQRPEPAMRLAAAQLLLAEPAVDGAETPNPAIATRRAQAFEIFRALRAQGTDPIVLRAAVSRCWVDAAICDADDAIRRLLDTEPRNAENLLLALGAADHRGDGAEVARLVSQLAQADHFDGGLREVYRQWSQALALVADHPHLPTLAGSWAVDARPLPPAIAIGSVALGRAMATPMAGRGELVRACEPEVMGAAGPARAGECRRIAHFFRVEGPSLWEGLTGFRIAYALATDDAERAALEQDWRRHSWVVSAMGTQFDLRHADGLAAWRLDTEAHFQRLLTNLTEHDAFKAGRRARGLPVVPPADYRPTQTLAELAVLRRQGRAIAEAQRAARKTTVSEVAR